MYGGKKGCGLCVVIVVIAKGYEENMWKIYNDGDSSEGW